MLETIKNGILSIVDFFTTIFDFVVGFIQDSVDFISKLPNAVAQVTELVSKYLPLQVLGIFITILSVVVILRIVGRT